MILDYEYSTKNKKVSISYIRDDGQKDMLTFNNIARFRSYDYDPEGPHRTWDDKNAVEKYVDRPSKTDLKRFVLDILQQPKYAALLEQKTFPKFYSFDIETDISDDGSFPNPDEARQAITTISVVSPNMNAIVFGTKELTNEELKYCENKFHEWLDSCEFYKTLKLPKPEFKYTCFGSEKEMLEIFIKKIVAKVPVLGGWNSILFDWQYISNRIMKYYPDISLAACSCNWQTRNKNYMDFKKNKIKLRMPNHTLLLDMMDVIDSEDKVVLPIKESSGLDYIAYESIGMHKIQYDGSLKDLYNNDYKTYVFYNCIDSILVQLINHRFKVLNHIYLYGLYCTEKLESCFSKIALTEALVFKDFYKNNIKVVNTEKDYDKERGTLKGAYVKIPIPGKHRFVACNDFASLYPSNIITCNLSFENYIPEPAGGWDETTLEKFRKDSNYFVSVNNNVYKSDKDYAFKRIQQTLKNTRNISKYLAKKLDASVMFDLEHLQKNTLKKNTKYKDDVVGVLTGIGYNITCSEDLKKIVNIEEFKSKVKGEITYYSINELAMKLLGNSMYGGSSHMAFQWYNMALAGDITGESRNLTHMMEQHLSVFWRDNWFEMKDLHAKLGIEVDSKEVCDKYLQADPVIYGDTDSLYIEYNSLLNTIKGVNGWTNLQKCEFIVKLNEVFLNEHNSQFIKDYFASRHANSIHEFELETVSLSGVWIDVKKRYAQILLWKDGKYFDEDNLPLKVKGLEIIKSSIPKYARNMLKELVRLILEDDSKYTVQKLNIKMQEFKREWMNVSIDEICANVNVNLYTKYVIDDENTLKLSKGAPFNVKALAMYNYIIKHNKLKDQPIYGGKMKWFVMDISNNDNTAFFAYPAGNYPSWGLKYARPNRSIMFKQFVLSPLNRIIEALGMPTLGYDGNITIQGTLF